MAENLQKQVIIDIHANTDGFQQGAGEVKSTLDNLNNTPVDAPIKSLKAQLKQANDEAQKMAVQFGKNSKQFTDAAKEVAKLTDEFDEYKKAVDSFNPDNKFQALVGIARGATGAIQGIAGGMAFLGIEGEKANETMAKLQGLMAFSQALNSVDDIKNGFKNFANVLGFTKTQASGTASALDGQSKATKGATVATKGLGTAFKALGIGLFISAVAFLVDNFDSIRTTLVKVFPWLENIGGLFNKVKAIAFGLGNAIMKYVATPFKVIAKIVQGDFKGALEEIKSGVFGAISNFNEGYNNQIKAQQEDARIERVNGEIETSKQTIEILKARGRDTYALEKENFKKRLSVVKEGSDEYKQLKQEEAVFEAGHEKQLEDKRKQSYEKAASQRKAAAAKAEADLKAEREKLKQHLEEIEKITEESQKNIAISKLNDREKELFAIDSDFNDKKKKVDDNHKEDKTVLEKQLKAKQLTQAQFTAAVQNLDAKALEATTALTEEKGIKTLEVEKKYNKLISEFIDGYQQTAYEKSRAKLISDFDEKIKVADEKQKEVLQKLKDSELSKLDNAETLRIDTVNKETNLIETQETNVISEDDTPEQRTAKLDAVYQAEKAYKDAKFLEDLAKLDGDETAINQLKAKKRKEDTDNERANSEAKKAIIEAEKNAKMASMKALGQAANMASELLGKHTVAGKALAIASTTIDTYQSAMAAYKGMVTAIPGPAGIVAGVIAAGASVATGIANVKKILSVKVPAKGGDGGGAGAAPSFTAPSINSTQLSPELANKVQDVRVTNENNQPVKAYIVDRDLKDNEEKTAFLNKVGSF